MTTTRHQWIRVALIAAAAWLVLDTLPSLLTLLTPQAPLSTLSAIASADIGGGPAPVRLLPLWAHLVLISPALAGLAVATAAVLRWKHRGHTTSRTGTLRKIGRMLLLGFIAQLALSTVAAVVSLQVFPLAIEALGGHGGGGIGAEFPSGSAALLLVGVVLLLAPTALTQPPLDDPARGLATSSPHQ